MVRSNAVRAQMPKLTVFVEKSIKNQICREKDETGLTIEEIVHRRLTRSFEERPILENASI